MPDLCAMVALLIATAAPPEPTVRVFSGWRAAACESARLTIDRLEFGEVPRYDKAFLKGRRAWLQACSTWNDSRIDCARAAEDVSDVASCAKPHVARCQEALPHALALLPELRLTAAQCALMSAEVPVCLRAAETKDDVLACDPRGACAEAVQVIAELASADPTLPEKQRPKIVVAVTSPKSLAIETLACTSIPVSVRSCVESSEATADLAECTTVPGSWVPPSDGASSEPFTAAIESACAARNARRSALSTEFPDDDITTDGECGARAFDVLRCESNARTPEALRHCAADHRDACGRAIDHVIELVLKDGALPEEVQSQLSTQLAENRPKAITECMEQARDAIECLSDTPDFGGLSQCISTEQCRIAANHLSEVLASDPAPLPRERRAALASLQAVGFSQACQNAPRSLRECVMHAKTWALARACANPAPTPEN